MVNHWGYAGGLASGTCLASKVTMQTLMVTCMTVAMFAMRTYLSLSGDPRTSASGDELAVPSGLDVLVLLLAAEPCRSRLLEAVLAAASEPSSLCL